MFVSQFLLKGVSMRRSTFRAAAFAAVCLAAAGAGLAGELSAQTRDATPAPLAVGAVAPDFELPGATRYGVLDRPVRLSDYKGEIVVLAFFFKARTKG
jgi:peroxiredoxin Q/BCP